MHDRRVIVVHALSVTGSAFVLHYLWENMQCPRFFIHTGGDAGQPAMVFATLGDVAMTWIAQGLVAVVSKRWLWVLGPWRFRQWALLLVAALALSFLVESWALATSLWAYTVINPRVPGMSISALPEAQMLLLFPLTFGLSRKIVRLAWNSNIIAGPEQKSPLNEISSTWVDSVIAELGNAGAEDLAVTHSQNCTFPMLNTLFSATL